MKISGVKAVLSAQDLKCTTGKANLCPQEFLEGKGHFDLQIRIYKRFCFEGKGFEGKVSFTNCCTYILSETFFECNFSARL